jgi:hypothetical protein
MHIVRTDNQLLKIVPRSYSTANVVVTVTNETTNTSEQETITPVASGNHIELTGTFTFAEGIFYYFVVSQAGSEIYRGNIFCTDQTDLEDYTVNQGQYEIYEKANANEYITI